MYCCRVATAGTKEQNYKAMTNQSHCEQLFSEDRSVLREATGPHPDRHKPLLSAVLLAFYLLCSAVPSHAQTPPDAGRAILFVHGWCATYSDWTPVWNQLILDLPGMESTLYPKVGLHPLYYDGVSVKQWPSGEDASSIPASARFFAINFYAPGAFDGANIDITSVAQVSIF